MDKREKNYKFSWVEGVVDESDEHFKLTYKDCPGPAALLGKGDGTQFVVRFLIAEGQADSEKILKAVRHELDYYLVKSREENPWAYAQYHCSSGANVYSDVHWSFCDKDGKCYRSQVYCIDNDAAK